MTNPPMDLDYSGRREDEIGGYSERGTRLRRKKEGAGFKAGIESDDKVGDASVRWMGSFSGRSSVIVRGLAGGADRPDQVPSPFIYHLSSASIHLFAFLPVSTPLPPSRVFPPHSPHVP